MPLMRLLSDPTVTISLFKIVVYFCKVVFGHPSGITLHNSFNFRAHGQSAIDVQWKRGACRATGEADREDFACTGP